jgi:hypothetical protein
MVPSRHYFRMWCCASKQLQSLGIQLLENSASGTEKKRQHIFGIELKDMVKSGDAHVL